MRPRLIAGSSLGSTPLARHSRPPITPNDVIGSGLMVRECRAVMDAGTDAGLRRALGEIERTGSWDVPAGQAVLAGIRRARSATPPMWPPQPACRPTAAWSTTS